MKLTILSELFSNCLWWLLFWMFLSFLLGWLLRKLFGGNDDNNNCCDELADLKRKYAAGTNEKIATVPVGKSDIYSKLKNDNLQIIEGIGPKMDEVLKKHGIGNWSALAGKSFNDLRGLLDKENPTRYKIIDPTTWSDQAQLAVDGKWAALIQMQKDLDTGRTNTIGDTDSKLEKIMQKLGILKKWKKDDLKAIEGIGPKIAELLSAAGILTWKKLSETSISELKGILTKGGDRYKLADPGTWAKQAQLADEEKWEELQEYQDFLDGGR